MVLQKPHSVSGSDSDEDELSIREPLTQRDPDDRPPSAEDQLSEVNSPTKSSNKEKAVSVNSSFTVELLTPDDEIYTLQCPEKFNVQDLCKKDIDFSQFKSSITSKNKLYQLEILNTNKKSISLAIPKKTSGSTLVNLPLKGHVIIKKVVDVAHGETEDEDADNNDKYTVAFPSDIKVRHPLLGADWKTHIDLVNEVLKKKKSMLYSDKKDKSLKRKKENKELKSENSDSDLTVPKKKKKHS